VKPRGDFLCVYPKAEGFYSHLIEQGFNNTFEIMEVYLPLLARPRLFLARPNHSQSQSPFFLGEIALSGEVNPADLEDVGLRLIS